MAHILSFSQGILQLGPGPSVMGVLNVTPDSFSDGGRYASVREAVEAAKEMVRAGAAIIDVGGESTRPGASRVSVEEELARVLPVVESLVAELTVLVSVDTTRSEVAERCLAAGAAIVNDVSAATWDERMLATVARHGAGLVLMHSSGTPDVMMQRTSYKNLLATTSTFLAERCDAAVRAGVAPELLIVDPGIGFGKTTAQNLLLLAEIEHLRPLGKPILVGLSRKAFLGEICRIERPAERDAASAAAHGVLAFLGVDLLRAHDVRGAVEAAQVGTALRRARPGEQT